MSDATAQARAEIWGGGVRPYAVPSKKLGMWLFIVSDSLTFSALLVTYSYARLSNPNWPTPFHGSSIALSSVMTFCLLSSSLTMVMAVAAAHQDRRKQAARWLFATIAGGLVFIVLHGYEWYGLITHEGVTPFSNPWGTPLFGATFFTLTGLHMTHVAVGVIYLTIVALGFRAGRWTGTDVEVSGLYWHFVDLVWMFIFPLVYLMSAKI